MTVRAEALGAGDLDDGIVEVALDPRRQGHVGDLAASHAKQVVMVLG